MKPTMTMKPTVTTAMSTTDTTTKAGPSTTTRGRKIALVTTEEACELLDISRRTWRRLRDVGGDLAHVPVAELGGPNKRTQLFAKRDIVEAKKAMVRKARDERKAQTKANTTTADRTETN